MAMFFPLVALCIFVGALAQITTLGPCPEVETVSEFDISKHSGTWHQIETYAENPQVDIKCETDDFHIDNRRVLYGVNTRISRWTGVLIAVKSRYVHDTEPGKFKVKHSFAPKPGNLSFLATDHVSYAVTYNCVQYGAMNTRSAWVWTREHNASESVMAKIIQVTDKNNLARKNFQKIKQDNCDLAPDVEITE